MNVIKDTIKKMERLLEEMQTNQTPSLKDLQYMHEVMGILAKAETVCAMREGGRESEEMEGYSGRHHVRGHYSRGMSGEGNHSGNRNYSGNSGYSGEGSSGRYSGRYSGDMGGSSGNYSGNYSRGYSGHTHEQMIEQLEHMANEAESERVRSALTDAMNRIRQ